MGAYDRHFGVKLHESPDARGVRPEKQPAYPIWHLVNGDIEGDCVTSVQHPALIRLNGYPAVTWRMAHQRHEPDLRIEASNPDRFEVNPVFATKPVGFP